MFLDEAQINIKAGDGGNGIVSFFLLKGSYKKIACGGNGARGGNVIIKATPNLNTLLGFKKQVHFKAENGQAGMPNNKTGRTGEDLIIHVPTGTIIKAGDQVLADLKKDGQEYLAAVGGSGGRGNANFVSQERRFPGFAEKGEKAEEAWINLELRLLADVALVGFPNSGKSTIISRISAAKPKIADYPFTTLTPNLGVVTYNDNVFVVADIPGIIEGAHKGVGLGIRFLRHVLRSKILAVVLDASLLLENEPDELIKSFQVIRNEVKLYEPSLFKRDYIVIINKTDLFRDRDELDSAVKELKKKSRKPVLMISAVSGEGTDKLVKVLYERVLKAKLLLDETEKAKEVEEKSYKVYSVGKKEHEKESFEITKVGEEYIVKNARLERLVSMTNLENKEALEYLKNRLKRMKIADRLKRMGIELGSTVIIGNLVFELLE
jgi:GTP-binding protein